MAVTQVINLKMLSHFYTEIAYIFLSLSTLYAWPCILHGQQVDSKGKMSNQEQREDNGKIESKTPAALVKRKVPHGYYLSILYF